MALDEELEHWRQRVLSLTARVNAAHQARHVWLLREAELLLKIDEQAAQLRHAHRERPEASPRDATSPQAFSATAGASMVGEPRLLLRGDDPPPSSPLSTPGVAGYLPPLPLATPSLEEVASLAEASVAHVGSLAGTLRTQVSDFLLEWYAAVSESQYEAVQVRAESSPAEGTVSRDEELERGGGGEMRSSQLEVSISQVEVEDV